MQRRNEGERGTAHSFWLSVNSRSMPTWSRQACLNKGVRSMRHSLRGAKNPRPKTTRRCLRTGVLHHRGTTSIPSKKRRLFHVLRRYTLSQGYGGCRTRTKARVISSSPISSYSMIRLPPSRIRFAGSNKSTTSRVIDFVVVKGLPIRYRLHVFLSNSMPRLPGLGSGA